MAQSSKKEMRRQRDFSAGEIFSGAKRRDDLPFIRSGGRQALNWRQEAIGTLVPRPARRALFAAPGPRTEYVRMSPTAEFLISYSSGTISIFDLSGNIQAKNTSVQYLWTNATIGKVCWAQVDKDIVVTFPSMAPQICRYTASSNTWDFLPFAFRISGGATYESFFRASVLGATMTPSGTTGAIVLTCSTAFFTAGMVGAKLSVLGQQVQILSIIDNLNANVQVAYQLPVAIKITVADASAFQVGQISSTKVNGVKIEISAVDYGLKTVTGTLMGQLTLPTYTWTSEVLVSQNGSSAVSGVPPVVANGGTVQWLEEFMGATAGWPQACFYDKGRLGFCDFPQKPEAILWSAVNQPDIFWIDSIAAANSSAAGADASSAILEFIPGKPRVRHVVGWGDEFIFTDNGIFQVPISGQNPLKPGSVEFRVISRDGSSGIRPIPTLDCIVYVNSGLNRISCVFATGSYTRPYTVNDLSDAHKHLFAAGPVMFSISSGDGAHPERYVYVVNADGTSVVGKFGTDKQLAGWMPHKSLASVNWVSSSGPNVYFTSLYPSATQWICEAEDDSTNLDGFISYSAIPGGLSIAGKGQFWWFANQMVTLLDGWIDLGDRQVDALGNLVLQNGDILTSPTLLVGAIYTSVFEPFVVQSQEGQSLKQSQTTRSISRCAAAVIHNNGFTLGKTTFPQDFLGADTTIQPVLKENTYLARQLGQYFDPRISLVKARPGIFRLMELSLEVTV